VALVAPGEVDEIRIVHSWIASNDPPSMSLDDALSFAPSALRERLGWTNKEAEMGLMDKLTGRTKQAAGDLTDDASLRREGKKEERKGEAKDELARSEERADAKADEVADLERRT
jgi:uncharacterized protein YjbJ (UPF0337 family)